MMHRLMSFPPMPVLRVLGKPLIWRLAVILGVIEAIFLAESFTTLMEHALRLGGNGWDVLHLLSFKLPEILDLALAIGLLIATFFATQEARNRGELVILATAGVHWARVIGCLLFVGLLGGLLSFLNAGLVLPMAKYGERLALADLQTQHVLSRIQNGPTDRAVQTIGTTTFVALPDAQPAPDRRGQLLTFEPQVLGQWRLSQSRNWHVTEPAPTNAISAQPHVITLEDLTVYEAPYPTGTAPPPLNRFTTRTAGFDVVLSDALPETDQTRATAERLLTLRSEDGARIVQLACRALMVPMAAVLALAALVLAGQGPLRHIALPLAVVGMLAVDVASRALLSGWSATVPAPLLIAMATLFYLAPPLAVLWVKAEALMRPERARA